MRAISVFGATGSIGESTFDLVMRAGGPKAFRTVALTGGRNAGRLAEMARALRPDIAVIAEESRLADLRAAVAALHGAGIGVILDVVFNPTGESDAQGPTLSL
ncbi:MAG: hypothetical protein IH625_04860, partial [Rhodobacteraceae bacterium]|nr:hypothetical protein [Paracoccaceae bacterium]